MITLHSTTVAATLDRLYREAERRDGDVLPLVRAQFEKSGTPYDDRIVAGLLDDAYIGVAPEVGRLLYQLVRLRRPKLVVEFGTSFGLSAIHIAAALADNGQGRLIATELNAEKASRAVEHSARSGSRRMGRAAPGRRFRDVGRRRRKRRPAARWMEGALSAHAARLEPALWSGALVVADDLNIMPEMLEPYIAYVRDPANGYSSSEIPLHDKLELSIRG